MSNDFSSSSHPWLLVLALIISITGIIVSFWSVVDSRSRWALTENDIKARWKATELGDIIIADSNYFYWKSIPEKEVGTIEFGYSPSLIREATGYRFGDECLLRGLVVAWDEKRNQPFPGTEFVTVNQTKSALKNKNAPFSQVTLRLHLKFQIEFKKTGNTAARDFTVAVDTKAWEYEGWLEGRAFPATDLYPGMNHLVTMDLYPKIETPVPDSIHFRIRINYIDADGVQQSRDIERDLS
jgi:hypothetical protein